MKIITSILCCLLMILTSCLTSDIDSIPDSISLKIIKNVSKRLNAKYDLILSGTGAAEDKGIWKINISYNRYNSKILDLQEARKIIILCAEEFLKDVNSNEEFRPHMKVYPFTAKNLSISIFNYDENRRDIHFPYISTISLCGGNIYYKSLGKTVMEPYARKIVETYEEALELLKAEEES